MDLPSHVVLSRKGFDSEHGCIPSPILSDGTMISLPIPGAEGTVSYGDLSLNGHSFGKLVTDLKAKRKTRNKETKLLSVADRAHLDPDLIFKLRQRKPGWRPAFGPGSKEVTILLEKQGVGKGDLFIFFGWFRRCELYGGAYRHSSGAPNVHVMFGYLRVGDIIRLSYDPVPEWAKDHPHLHFSNFKNNTLFVAADRLGIPGIADLPGAASFPKFANALQLTAPEMTRSWWRLPKWFYPKKGAPPLSSHHKPYRWHLEGNACLLQSVALGQEFVLDMKHYPEAVEWIADLIRQGMA